ncbi:glucans biosynthesis glucosyltransferase MdoH [Ferrovum myxofaciens]|uniref:glucans biosynthesis glucosyltransferase MdoH n=1 Tax=Ferrovum myxofaciens TaxID=416213 RepID=UPI002354E3C4|nr:glucans biosynthesis glucosyltransferase MdoH [Ferrovum myxofaciens]
MNPYDLIPLTRPDLQAPPLNRGSMISRPWSGFWNGFLQSLRALLHPPRRNRAEAPLQAWETAATLRRRALGAGILFSSVLAGWSQWPQNLQGLGALLGWTQWTLFVLLFAWVSAGFLTAVLGFWVQLHPDPHALAVPSSHADLPLDPGARTALIMPICHEQVRSVFAGLRATCESLAATRDTTLFDVFVLSDSSDPAILAEEQAAWRELHDQLGHRLNLFYRVRARRGRKKAGNVADFCRRWGKDYRYMVVLDADSVMTGSALTSLVGLMERNPSAGIIQTLPRSVGLDTVHARSQQFAGRVTGQLFTAGMQYWQLGESHYWGHNAILRIAPFMRHCGLALLPGKGNLSGEILSHDFVEAALLRRAGYHTWIVPGLEGSYEQQPAHLLEELQRDRRWCQGNLKNFRLLWEPGFHAVHRAMLLTGVLAYASAPLWMAYILVSLSLTALNPHTPLLPALWPVTLSMLFIPRLLALLALFKRGEQAKFGGTSTLLASAFTEATLSLLQAPLRMVAHTLFVLTALTGFRLEWKSPAREASTLAWRSTWQHYRGLFLIATGGLALASLRGPTLMVDLLPIALPWLLAAPLAIATSHSTRFLKMRGLSLLDIPEERRIPSVLRRAWHYAGLQPLPSGVSARFVRSGTGTQIALDRAQFLNLSR